MKVYVLPADVHGEFARINDVVNPFGGDAE